MAEPSANGSPSRELLIEAAVTWEPGLLNGVFGARSGIYHVSVSVTVPGVPARTETRTAEPRASDRETSAELAKTAADLLGVLLGKGTPCDGFKLKGTVKQRGGNASYQQTQDGAFTASIAVLRSADEYLAAHPASSAAEEQETRQFFADAQAKGEYLVQGEGEMTVAATFTPTQGGCQGSRTETKVPVLVFGSLSDAGLSVQVMARVAVKLGQSCSGVACNSLTQGLFCPGGATDPSQGHSEMQLPMLTTGLAGNLLLTTEGDGTATLNDSDTDGATSWTLAIVGEDEAPAVAVHAARRD